MTTNVKTRKREAGGAFVLMDGVTLGYVEQVETSRTGFRRGYCVGQVTCKTWRAYALMGERRIPHAQNTPSRFGTPGGFATRAKAIDALMLWRSAEDLQPENAQ